MLVNRRFLPLSANITARLLQRPINGQVAIRPESIALATAGGSGGMTAVIKRHSLLGSVIRYRVEALCRTAGRCTRPHCHRSLSPNCPQASLTIDASAIHRMA
ncbi:TOBE domain-containing protein [Stutzerimonas marianensis]